MPVEIDTKTLLPAVMAIVREAGKIVMEVYETDFETFTKTDASPVTAADLKAEAYITPKLEALLPGVKVVGEEAASEGDVPTVGDEPFWLVDPVDGTKEFLNKNGEFTVNIALIVNKEPLLGVVLAPARDTLYAGVVGQGAVRRIGTAEPESISVRDVPEEGVTIVASRRHGDPELLKAFLGKRRLANTINAGSSLKFCLVASGEADLYPRFGPTCEWDTGAGDAVLRAAGGLITFEDGHTPFVYAKRADFLNPHFVAWGSLRQDS